MRILVLILLPVLLFVYIAMFLYDVTVMPHDNLTIIIQYQKWSSAFWYAFEWSAMLSMFYFGSFRKYKYLVWALIGFAFAAVGKLFVLQHWPFGRLILLTGSLLFILIYSLHFWKKKKILFDILKYCFVISWVFAPIIRLSIRGHNREVNLVDFIISIAVFSIFYYYLWKNLLNVHSDDRYDDYIVRSLY